MRTPTFLGTRRLFRGAFERRALLAWPVLAALVAPAIALDLRQEAKAAPVLHLALESSSPAADATVGAIQEIRLFFTQAPNMDGTSVRLADGMNELVDSSEAIADGEDSSQVFIEVQSPLAAGSYTVHWRAIAQDGHAVNGDFGFQVATE